MDDICAMASGAYADSSPESQIPGDIENPGGSSESCRADEGGAAALRAHALRQPALPHGDRGLAQLLQQGLSVLIHPGDPAGPRKHLLLHTAYRVRILDASGNSLAKPEMEVMAARSSWRSMSLSYSTLTSLPHTCSSA